MTNARASIPATLTITSPLDVLLARTGGMDHLASGAAALAGKAVVVAYRAPS